VQEVFGFVKKNLSGAQRRKSAASRERGAGKGAAALVPAQRWRNHSRLGSISKLKMKRSTLGFGKIEAGGFFNKSSRVVVRPPGKTCW